MPFTELFERKKLYMSPLAIQELANTLGGNFQIHPFSEPSYDGYFTVDNKTLYKLESKNRATDKVGEQEIEYSVILSKMNSNKTMTITWKRQSNGDESPGKNTEVKSFTVKTNPAPGETVFSSQDFLLVDLEKLESFYGKKLEFNEDEMILYVID